MAPSNNDASQQAARKRPRLGENYSPNTASSTPPLRNPYSNNTKRKQVPAAAMVPPRNRRPVADERPMLDYMGKRTGFDHHYSNEYNYAYGDGSGRKRGGRNPKDMKITEVLSQRLMEAMHLSEGGTAITASKDSEPEEQLTKALEVQRKKRFDRSKMEGDISQLALQNNFFVGGVRVGWPYPKILSPQRQMAIHLIKALKDKKHVVLESPTGTGKSAAILCSVLAWQR